MQSERPAIDGGPPVRRSVLRFFRLSIGAAERRAVDKVLRSGWITSGPQVARFERFMAREIGHPHTVAVSSCTEGMLLALDALGVGAGHEVITTPLTFASTANVIVHRGARPRFADVDPDTLTLDPSAVSKLITRKTRALLPVHLGGQPCDLDGLRRLARRRGLRLIDDAAHALGARDGRRAIGRGTDATVFSFHAVKNLTTGEGGLVSASTAALAKRIRLLAFHGLNRDAWRRFQTHGWRYRIEAAGYKANFTDLQAAIGIEQLKKFGACQRRRKAIAASYTRALSNYPELVLPRERPGTTHAWHLYLMRLRLDRLRVTRDRFLDALAAEGVLGNVHYTPLHLQPYYRRRFGYRPGACPVAERAAREVVTLPLYPAMTDGDARDVIHAVGKLVRAYAR